MALRYGSALALVQIFIAGCSGTFTPQTCTADADCPGGLVCDGSSGQPACVNATSAPLRVGISAPMSGPSQELGIDMQEGIALAFDAQNAAGGVNGRPLVLVVRDDGYEPPLAEKNARSLLDVHTATGAVKCPTTNKSVVAGQAPVSMVPLDRGDGAVLGLLGDVGTPTMVLAAPVTLETSSLFFGAFTGASLILRDDSAGPCKKYVFNVRASYAQEARAALEYFFLENVPDASHLISFDQDDSFGDAGYDGLVAAYEAIRGRFTPPPADPATPIPRFRYTRDDDASVPVQVAAAAKYLGGLLADGANHTVGIFMTDTYGPAAAFITGIRQWQYANDAEQAMNHKATHLTLHMVNVSFVGPNSLASRLTQAGTIAGPSGNVPYTNGVILSQVVPNYESDQSEIVQDYLSKASAAGKSPSFTSLEGYAAARIFIAGLSAHQGLFTPDALIPTFEGLPDLSLGLGASAGYGPGDHDYSKSVWGTSLDGTGAFQNAYYWIDGTPLQLFE